MCTCINWFIDNKNYFGRTLDSIEDYGLNPIIVPRGYKFEFNDLGYALIGMGTVIDNYPLLAEATNEYGLSMAGLEFVDNAYYNPMKKDLINVASYNLIPFVLRQCKTIEDVKALLKNINITDHKFNGEIDTSDLHWMISQKDKSIVFEQTKNGVFIYDNIYNVMTNNPPFFYHLENIKNYINLSAQNPVNKFINNIDIQPFSNGIGSFMLPGDYSSSSRFIKACFLSFNKPAINEYSEIITHYFNILSAISPIKGIVVTEDNKYNYTIYQSCMDTANFIYYYKSYKDLSINMIQLTDKIKNESMLKVYSLF